MIEVGAHTDCLFQTGNENLFSSVRKHCAYFILPSEFWVSIQVNKNRPILGNFRWLWKSVYKFISLSPLSLLIYFKNNNRIQNKLVLEEQKSGCDDDSIKWKNPNLNLNLKTHSGSFLNLVVY